ncbi:MAG: hypothetical protein LWX54_10500, partial [Deltaproteobacteria bacterium]|nr:hypothetical protein [Deltaproteobacteria bacterium]
MIGKLRTRLFYTILLGCLAFWSFNAIDAFADIIIDNGDPGTSFTGAWSVSGGLNPWNPDDPSATSLWSKNNDTYTWTFTPSISGTYEFSMWWTTWSSYSTNVPVIIEHAAGSTVV